MEAEANITNTTFEGFNLSFFKHDLSVSLAFIFSYALVCLLCVVGNGTVCCLVAQNRKLHTVTNVFILNLAVADLMIAIFCIPITLVNNLVRPWLLGNIICKLTPFIQGLSVGASVFTLVAIATDRYFAIVRAPKGKLRGRHAVIIVMIVWVLATVVTAPHAVVMEARPHPYIQGESCQEFWPDMRYRMAYTVVLFLVLFVAPLLAVAFMYERVIKQMCTKAPGRSPSIEQDSNDRDPPSWTEILRLLRSQKSSSSSSRDVRIFKKVRVVKMLLVVVVFFAICWLPLHLVTLVSDFGNLTYDQLVVVYDYLYPVAHFLAYFNSCVNPIVYGYYNRNFTRVWRERNGTVRLCCFRNTQTGESFRLRLVGATLVVTANVNGTRPDATQQNNN